MVRKLVALSLCFVLLLGGVLGGCAPKVSTEAFVGSWELASGSEEGLDAESIALAKTLGSSVVLTLQEDGAGTLDMYGEVSNLTWSASSDSEGTCKVDGSAEADMKVEDDQLSLYDADGGSLTFARS